MSEAKKQEDEVVAVPDCVSEGAHIKGMHNYMSMWERSVNAPDECVLLPLLCPRPLPACCLPPPATALPAARSRGARALRPRAGSGASRPATASSGACPSRQSAAEALPVETWHGSLTGSST